VRVLRDGQGPLRTIASTLEQPIESPRLTDINRCLLFGVWSNSMAREPPRRSREGVALGSVSTTLNAANSLIRVRGPERFLFFLGVLALLVAVTRLLTRRSLLVIFLRMIALLLLGALQLLFFLPVHWFLLCASDPKTTAHSSAMFR
jgi:hypothetical protein